jgi:AcrR family transcriptional regulator
MAAILEAAAQVVLQDGEAGFNTNRIAERAGVSIGTLYQYFPDKAAILNRLIDDWRDQAIARIDESLIAAAHNDADVAEAVRQVVRVVLQTFGGGDPALRPMARLAWRHDREDRIAQSMRVAAERLGLRLQAWAAARGAAMTPERLYIATRAVLGTIRYASLEASPLLDSPALEQGLCRVALAALQAQLPSTDNPAP